MENELSDILQACDNIKTILLRNRPLPSESLKKIEDALAIEYTYESNRIEGNTLTLQETELVVNEGVTISGKSLREHLEASHMKKRPDAFQKLVAKAEKADLERYLYILGIQ